MSSYTRYITHDKGCMEFAIRKGSICKKNTFLIKRKKAFYLEIRGSTITVGDIIRLKKRTKYSRRPNRNKGYLIVRR